MVLRPEDQPEHQKRGLASAWEAISRAQKIKSSTYYLVRQPDHARLSGQIAEQLAIAGAPALHDDIMRGISLHDEGWTDFDNGHRRLQATSANYSAANIASNAEGKPLSFLEIKAGDFLQAWQGSIESAEAVAPIAGLIVSGHFRRIARFGMSAGTYTDNDTQLVRQFIAGEEERAGRLLRLQSCSEKEVEYWIDVLQFCDLLSLYLCCGSEESVEFPQRIGPKGEAIRLRVKDGVNVLAPSPFAQELEFSLPAHSFSTGGSVSSVQLSWRVR